jgi:hypothetical protein
MVDEGTLTTVRLRPLAGAGLRIRATDFAKLVEDPDDSEVASS